MMDEFHRLADIFPLIEGDGFDQLVADVKERGVLEPIWLYEGKILDGRNRYRAAREAGRAYQQKHFPDDAPPKFRDDPLAFVISLNLHRRQLTASQLAFVALDIERVEAELAKERMRSGGGDKKSGTAQMPDPIIGQGEAREKAAKAVGASARYVSDAKKIERDFPELAKEIRSGKKNITQANRVLKETTQKDELQRAVYVTLAPGLHRGDFRTLADQIEDNSVELVFTDPPYDADSVPLYGDAAKVAARILKPGGSFIAYSGHPHLPAVLNECGEYLRYWWTIAAVHDGGPKAIMHQLGIRVAWKPLVWFVKDTRGDVRNVLFDVVAGKHEKDFHEWQQSEQVAHYCIERLTSKNGLVVDFFAGGGTTLVAAKKLGRKFIGFEINAASIERASQRILASESPGAVPLAIAA